MMRFSGLLLSITAALLMAPDPMQGQEKGEWRTVYAGPGEAVHAAVLQPGDYRRLLAHIQFSGWQAGPPQVDFSKQMAVGICLGRRPTGGYAVNFLSADREKERGKEYLIIRYEEVRPGGFVTQALTSPCLLKALPKPEGPEPRVLFERTSRQWFRNDLERQP